MRRTQQARQAHRRAVEQADFPNYTGTHEQFGHVLWLGGSPCAGKSSVADILCEKFELQVYRCDDHYARHLAQARSDLQPLMFRAKDRTWNQIWGRSIEQAVADEFQFYREEFGMILADILALPKGRRVIAEGAALLPECVRPLLAGPNRAAWMVPTEGFQMHHYSRRQWVTGILEQCDDPEAAFATWMGRDLKFADLIESEAKMLGFYTERVDGTKSIAEIAAELAAYFGLAEAVAEPRVEGK